MCVRTTDSCLPWQLLPGVCVFVKFESLCKCRQPRYVPYCVVFVVIICVVFAFILIFYSSSSLFICVTLDLSNDLSK